MRIIVTCTFALTLSACSSPQREAERAAAQQALSDCLVRESVAVAPQPVDLDTAALAVLARCDYPGVIERSYVAEHPGFRAEIHEMTQKEYAAILDTTKRGIVMLRTKGASPTGTARQ